MKGILITILRITFHRFKQFPQPHLTDNCFSSYHKIYNNYYLIWIPAAFLGKKHHKFRYEATNKQAKIPKESNNENILC